MNCYQLSVGVLQLNGVKLVVLESVRHGNSKNGPNGLKQLEVHESTIGVRPSVVRRRERLFISTLSL